MNSQTDSLKLIAFLAVIAIAGVSIYHFGGNSGFTGRALNTSKQNTETQTVSDSSGTASKLLPCTITSFSATPPSIASGASSSLSWSTQNCMTNLITQASTPVISSPLPSGQVSTGALTTTKTYLLTAIGENNSVTATTTVSVGTLSPCTINTFTTTPSSIPYNTASTMAWTTSNCTSASISPTINGVPTNGSISSGNLTTTTTFTLTATSSINTVTSTKTITVIPPPQCAITLFSATPSSITSGQASTLNWKTVNCNSANIDNNIGTVTPVAQGSITTGALTTTKTYKLTAAGINNTVTALTTVTVTPLACTPNTWTQKADFGGAERYNILSGFSIGSKGYIGMGSTSNALKKDFWEYDPSTNVWTQKVDFGGTARSATAGFSIGNKGYIGTGNDGNDRKDFWEYNPTTNTWTQKADFGGDPRYAAIGFSIGTKGYIGTGNHSLNNTQAKDFWEYDQMANTWTQKADFSTARQGAVGFSIGSKGYIGTGYNNNSGYLKDFWEYDQLTNVWTQKADFGGTARQLAVGFSIGSKGYLGTGDQNFAYKKDFWQYDPVTNVWTQKADFGGGERIFATGISVGLKGYIGTGSSSFGNYSKDFWEYCP